MPLNKQKGNMYGFVTHTWNTVKGKCPHDCSYCYMKRFKQPKLHFDEKELKTDLGSGNFIFVGSSCDMFAEEVDHQWIHSTLSKTADFPDNQYLFQSKNPRRMLPWTFGCFNTENYIVATTIETNRDYYNPKNAPSVWCRAKCFEGFFKRKMVTIEPIMDFDLYDFVNMILRIEPEQVNIGANSMPKVKLPEPEPEKVLELIAELEKFTKVYQKDNLKRLLKGKL